jgi:hypothetical protein
MNEALKAQGGKVIAVINVPSLEVFHLTNIDSWQNVLKRV